MKSRTWCMYGCGLRFEAERGTAFSCPGACGSYYRMPESGNGFSLTLPEFYPPGEFKVVQRAGEPEPPPPPPRYVLEKPTETDKVEIEQDSLFDL